MTPKIEALTDRLLALSQDFAAQQRPGVPIDMESSHVKQIRSLLEEIQRDVEQFEQEQTATYRGHAEAIKKSLEAEKQRLAAPPPPEEDPAILDVLGRVTFRFMDQYAPGREVMSPHVETLLKLAKE